MTVTTPRETSTDSPVADLSKKVEVGFAQMEAGFRRADERMDALEKKMDAGFETADKKMDAGFETADKKMDAGFERADEKMEAGFKRADERMDAGFARVDSDVRELRSDMTGLRKELLVAAVIVIAALLGLIGTHAF
jgi:hypothetical protein